MRRNYTLSATPRPPSLPPVGPLGSGRRAGLTANPKLRALLTWAGALTAISAAFGLPVIVAASTGMPLGVGLAAWVANLLLVACFCATAPPSEYHPPLRRGSGSYEPGGIGAYSAYRDLLDGGDGDGGGC